MTPPYDDPAVLAADLRRRPTPLMLAFDVDGVLAPIVSRADQARLLPGIDDALGALAAVEPYVAIVSGRSLDDLGRFSFPSGAIVIGSHGMETDGLPVELTGEESERLARLTALAEDAVAEAGDGAWVERKPASVVVHVRQADADRAAAALSGLRDRIQDVEGAHSIAGSQVLELFARAASKGRAIDELRRDMGIATCVYVGDDITDEAAFAVLGPGDLSIKVGDAETIAEHRLQGPDEVLRFVERLVATAADPSDVVG